MKFVRGFLSPAHGVALIVNNRTLQRLALLPFLMTLLVFIVGLSLGLPLITNSVSPFTLKLAQLVHAQNNPAFLTLIPFFIWPALALALVYVLLNITRLFASPFYGLLAERVLIQQGALQKTPTPLVKQLKPTLESGQRNAVKAFIFIVLGLVLGLLSFIPGVGLFTAAAFLVLLAYDIVDYALEAMAFPMGKRVEFFRQHFLVFLGLGASLGLVFLVPGLNFFVMPAAVAGAADLVRKMINE